MADTRIDEIRKLLPQAMVADWVRLGSRLVRLLRDRRHNEVHGAILDRLLEQARASVALRERRQLQKPTPTYSPALPITARKDEIVAAIRSHRVVIIAGETGSGKTTQLPKMCLEAGLGIEAKIGCTQPRRVAALSISRRIAEELNVSWGREVGCKIRFDDRASPESYIKVMTDGMLLAEAQGDPLLSEYNALLIDEAHERSLNIDFLLGYLKGLLARRPGLKLIITSATIDTESFSRAFNHAPVIEVSGRMFPVEVVYAPFDAESEESGDMTYVDAAVQAAHRVLRETGAGDVLIFMPGERDIRETSDKLMGRFAERAEVIPLFGRLSSGEQQRVFSPGSRRKLVVATNIAETSLTIPGIRFVIDAGLARISRYNPRTRTRRLPIEPIARSSAEQRKGRSGRVQDGVCIRLYSEADFEARPLYTQPEIQRANLAEVILRMKAFHLGEIESFPFIDPPSPASVQSGYRVLQELGALDDTRALTTLGKDLARLPIDPTLGRMLLQAEREHATRELLIIAAGLSIQDPRERPLDQKEAAAAAHKQFADPQSDFLTLLNIWNAVHEKWEMLPTQNQRRKFCKANFLSYIRMREWQDLHAQIQGVLEDLGLANINESNADYAAIHRAILVGLLGHVAQRTELNVYQASGNRQVTIFPGSALSAKGEARQKTKKEQKGTRAPGTGSQPEWIVAGEIVETSKLFARTLAAIDPLWICDLGSHLCRVTHHNPHWDAEAGRVLAEERTTLHGLEVQHRRVAYGNLNPKEATQIFIRAALVEGALWPEAAEEFVETDAKHVEHTGRNPRTSYDFLEHNRRVRQKIEICQTRMRRHDLVDLDEAFFKFYRERIQNVSSIDELNRFVREQPKSHALHATEADVIGTEVLGYDAEAFPDMVSLAGQSAPLSYAYVPGEEEDGVTVTLHSGMVRAVAPAAVEWAIPGLRESQIAELLKTLPKTLRRQLMPLREKVEEIVRSLNPSGESLKADLSAYIFEHYGVKIPATVWSGASLPAHLRPRIAIVNGKQQTIASGRDLAELRDRLVQAKQEEPLSSPAWLRMTQQWERFGVRGWTFGDLPERISCDGSPTPELWGYPGLELEEGAVNVRMFASAEPARQSSLAGMQRLVEMELQKELGWVQKDLRALARCEPLYTDFISCEELQVAAYAHLKNHLLPSEPFPKLAQEHFRAAVSRARTRLPGLTPPLLERIETIFKLRREILRRYGAAVRAQSVPVRGKALSDLKDLTSPARGAEKPGLVEAELDTLLPRNFLQSIPFAQLTHLPRYLKALLVRAEKAALNPVKDQERARQLAPYLAARRQHLAQPAQSFEDSKRCEEFRWMLEEFKVSLFAQELGTAFPISAKRLSQQLERIGKAG